jgi:hypothetical protein
MAVCRPYYRQLRQNRLNRNSVHGAFRPSGSNERIRAATSGASEPIGIISRDSRNPEAQRESTAAARGEARLRGKETVQETRGLIEQVPWSSTVPFGTDVLMPSTVPNASRPASRQGQRRAKNPQHAQWCAKSAHIAVSLFTPRNGILLVDSGGQTARIAILVFGAPIGRSTVPLLIISASMCCCCFLEPHPCPVSH